MRDLGPGLQLAYRGAGPSPGVAEWVDETERLGCASLWSAQASGTLTLAAVAGWDIRARWGRRTEATVSAVLDGELLP